MGARALELFIGVDAGGTQTRAVCMAPDGEILGSGYAGPANHVSGALERARVSISDAITEAAAFHRAPGPVPALATFIGSAGLEFAGDEAEGRRLLDERIASHQVFLDSDAYAAWAGAFRCQPGIVVIAGTGSMCLGIDASGQRVKAGGWGWRVGDEGSAYGIAIDAIRAALQTIDGRRDAVALWDALERFVGRSLGGDGGADVGALAVREWLYDVERSPADIAAFAPSVERMAADGCVMSTAILEHAGTELAAMVRVVAAGLASTQPLPIVVQGGVLQRNTVVRSAFRRGVEEVNGVGSVIESAYAPHVGAALLALRAMGRPLDAELFARLDGASVARPAPR